jgi:hypothetical protein
MEHTQDQRIVRELAKKIVELAGSERQARLKHEWTQFNDLQRVAPRVLIYPDGDGALKEVTQDLPQACSDPEYRALERTLRLKLFHFEHFEDDMPLEAVLRLNYVAYYSGFTYGLLDQKEVWGLPLLHQERVAQGGTYHMQSALKDERDVERLLAHRLEYRVDQEQSTRQQARLSEMLDGLLPVELEVNYSVLVASLVQDLVHLRTLQDLYIDLYDHADWLHAILNHMAEAKCALLGQLERDGWLALNNRDHYTGSGGVGYTTQLPAPGWEGPVRTRDLWGFADAQEFTDVSAGMFKEFVLPYQARVLGAYGLVSYGCCERLDKKWELVRRLPNLRRVSVSPWSNLRIAAGAIGRSAILSWKYTPNAVTERLDEAELARNIREALSVAGDCNLEIILKDIRTCGGRLENLTRWVEVVQGLVKNA